MSATLGGSGTTLLEPLALERVPVREERVPLRRRLGDWLRRNRASALSVLLLLVVTAIFQGIGQAGTPQWIDDEGTYVAQAWAVVQLHTLAPYTYWYDHPPLGWIQLAGFFWITGALHWASSAVDAGRVGMLLAQLITVPLLWTLARRLGFARWAAAVAVFLDSATPLAVQYHRYVYLDNIATVWTIAAFVLALSPRRRLAAYAASGIAFGVAVLSKETFLLLLPALVWQMWRSSAGATRRYVMAVAGSLFVITGAFYLLYAAVKGELFPGPGHVSLFGAVYYQLVARPPSGNMFIPGSAAYTTVHQWLTVDAIFPTMALLAVVPSLLVRRLWPITLGLVIMLGMMLRPGYLPVPFVIGMLPLGALLVAGVADAAWHWQPVPGSLAQRAVAAISRGARRLSGGGSAVTGRPTPRASLWGPRPLLPLVLAGGIVLTGFAVPRWIHTQRGLWSTNLSSPMTAAEQWTIAHIPHNQKIIVDDSMWVDLVRSGFPMNNIVWYYKVDTDPAVIARAPHGWRSYNYVISTNSMRTYPAADPQVAAAMRNSVPVARFGSGADRVTIRKIVPRGVHRAPTVPASAG